MVLVFILLGFIILVLLLSFLILISTFHIEIKDLEATNINKSEERLKQNNNDINNVKSESNKKARICNHLIFIPSKQN